jgi:hypothetical protein
MVYSNSDRSSKDCPTKLLSSFWIYFERKQTVLLIIAAISIVLLFVLHLSTVTMQIIPGSILHKFILLTTIFLLLPVAISIFWKGIVPIAICALGLTLLYAGVLYPSYVTEIVGKIYYKSSYGFTTEKSILNAARGYFLLGMGMVIFSIIIGYKPTILYTRNRPQPLDTIWQKYPIWYGNAEVMGYHEPSVSLKSLMTAEERYLLWRYEFVLTDIFGTPHLVRPDDFVPASSTIVRDKANQSMIGKAKYMGYFV